MPQHTHLPLPSLGLPLHIHTPRWAGHLEARGVGERIREEPSGVPGWVGGRRAACERQMCADTPGVRDVNGLQVHSMRCVSWGRVLYDLGGGVRVR